MISNPNERPQTARVYQTDYHFAADGTSSFEDPGTTPRSNAQWITPQSTRIVVPARSQLAVPYSVVVPSIDSLRGTYWSAIMVEGVSDDSVSGAKGSKPAVQLGAVPDRDAAAPEREPVLSVHRTMVRLCRLIGAPNLFENDGFRHYWFAQQLSSIPSNAIVYTMLILRQHFELGKLEAGSYKAVMFADTGGETISATQYTVKF